MVVLQAPNSPWRSTGCWWALHPATVPFFKWAVKARRKSSCKVERNTHTEEHRWAVDKTPRHTQKLTIFIELPRTDNSIAAFYVESCMYLTIQTVVREASPGLWLNASLQTNWRKMIYFSMHHGAFRYLSGLYCWGNLGQRYLLTCFPLHARSQPSSALWPLTKGRSASNEVSDKALNPSVLQFLHLWICLVGWMEENSLF